MYKTAKTAKRVCEHEEREEKSLSKPGNRKVLRLPGPNHGSSSTENALQTVKNGDAVNA